MLTPNLIVIAARAVLTLGAVTAAVLMLGPFQGLEQAFGLTDTVAHAVAFGGLTALAFVAFPRMRRADLAVAALILGGAVEIAQLLGGRSASLTDWTADAAGILALYGATLIEGGRKLARDHGTTPLTNLEIRDRRKPRLSCRARPTLALKPSGDLPTRFADRASRRFPRQPI